MWLLRCKAYSQYRDVHGVSFLLSWWTEIPRPRISSTEISKEGLAHRRQTISWSARWDVPAEIDFGPGYFYNSHRDIGGCLFPGEGVCVCDKVLQSSEFL